MVDHIRTLLLNPSGTSGYVRVTDAKVDAVLRLFGIMGACTDVDAAVVDGLLPLALADDLRPLRRFFDTRISPKQTPSVYAHVYTACCPDITCTSLSLDGLYDRVFGDEGRGLVADLFASDDADTASALSEFGVAASGLDAPYALGAVLVACAYRRLVLQGGS